MPLSNEIKELHLVDTENQKVASLDSIPEDVALVIAKVVKEWATIQGTLETKEKAVK